MNTIHRDDIPDFLKNSDLYKTLYDEDDCEITIPAKYFIDSVKLENEKDLDRLLETLRFWMANDIPDEIIEFVLEHNDIDYVNLFGKFRDLSFVDDFRILFGGSSSINMMRYAVKKNNLNLLKYLHSRKYYWDVTIGCDAIKYGYMDILKYFVENCEEIDSIKESPLLLTDITNMIQPYASSGTIPTDGVYTYNFALQPVSSVPTGHCNFKRIDDAEITLQLYDDLPTLYYKNLYYYAVTANNMECVKYLIEQKISLYHNLENHDLDCVFTTAVNINNFDMLKFFYKTYGEKCKWNSKTAKAASSRGYLEILKYLHEMGCSWDYNTYQRAVDNKHEECAIYAKENGCPTHMNIDVYATNYNILRIMSGMGGISYSN